METTTMTRSKEEAFSLGLMVESMTDSGTMGSRMVKEYISPLKEKSREENGKKEKELNGLALLEKSDPTFNICIY